MPYNPVKISAIVTAYQRIEQTLVTLKKLRDCIPPPAETLVHVDGNQMDCVMAIEAAFPDVRIIVSQENIGPGGGRNKLIAAAEYPIVASFDDDSYPIDSDYFLRVNSLFARFSEASVISARVFHVDEEIMPALREATWSVDFCGGACAYRREVFVTMDGYVPLPVAYGMEEVDLAMRLHAQRGRVLNTSWLRVFHDTNRARHADYRVTAASIANLALLTFLRYPRSLWAYGMGQCLNRSSWLMRNGRWRGVATGWWSIPTTLIRYRAYRGRLSASAVWSFLKLRRQPIPVSWNASDGESVGSVVHSEFVS